MLTEADWHQRLSKHAASGEKEHGRIQGVFDLSVRRVLQIELKWQSKKVLCIDYLQISNQCQNKHSKFLQIWNFSNSPKIGLDGYM